MSRWTDLAPRQEHTGNQGGAMVEHRGVVLHIAEGSYEGTIAWQKNPDADVSSNFIVDTDGDIAQMVDTDVTAWTQKAGNGHWLSIENAGHTPAPLTAAQVEAAARLLARAHREYGVPLQVTSDPDGRGLGHHSMGAHPGYPDDWGHSACPGKAIIDQKPAIVARAKEIIEGDDMPLSEAEIDKIADKTARKVWTLDGVKEAPDAPKPPHEDPDAATNPNWAAKSYLRRTYESTDQGLINDETQAAKLAEIEAKVDQILAALAGGPTLPPPGNNTSTTGKGTFRFELDPPQG